jgi:hypothetical protein
LSVCRSFTSVITFSNNCRNAGIDSTIGSSDSRVYQGRTNFRKLPMCSASQISASTDTCGGCPICGVKHRDRGRRYCRVDYHPYRVCSVVCRRNRRKPKGKAEATCSTGQKRN